MGEGSGKPNKYVVLAFLFGISYVFIYVLSIMSEPLQNIVSTVDSWLAPIPVLNTFSFFLNSIIPLPAFTSSMYWLLPIAGFFTIYFIADWINDYFKKELGHSPWIPLVFIILCFAAFYIASFWYWCNGFSMQSEPISACNSTGSQRAAELLANTFTDLFRDSSFNGFMIGGLLGWLASRGLKELLKE